MAHSCVVKVKRRGVSFGRIFLGRIEEVIELRDQEDFLKWLLFFNWIAYGKDIDDLDLLGRSKKNFHC